MPVNPSQIELVRRTHAQVEAVAGQAGSAFYRHLFQLEPAARALFAATEADQGRKLMDMIASLVEALEAPARFYALCHDLGNRHACYGVAEAHYDAVGTALLRTLREQLGPGFAGPVEEAWAALYGEIAETMMAAPGLSLAGETVGQ